MKQWETVMFCDKGKEYKNVVQSTFSVVCKKCYTCYKIVITNEKAIHSAEITCECGEIIKA